MGVPSKGRLIGVIHKDKVHDGAKGVKRNPLLFSNERNGLVVKALDVRRVMQSPWWKAPFVDAWHR